MSPPFALASAESSLSELLDSPTAMYGKTPKQTAIAWIDDTMRELYSIFSDAASGLYDGTKIGTIIGESIIKIG